MMKSKATVALLSAVTLVAGIGTVHVAQPAKGGGSVAGPTGCPSDVDNDGNVGILDFLQLLGDWGPCPSPPKPIAIASCEDIHLGVLLRQWSDGTLEAFAHPSDLTGLLPVGSSDVAPVSPHLGSVVDISVNVSDGPLCDDMGPCAQVVSFIGRFRVYRQYADGYAEFLAFSLCALYDPFQGCFNWANGWQPVSIR